MTQTVIYPGTFDPITLGHVDVINRACQIFERVIVAVAANFDKSPLLSFEKRLQLTRQVLAKNPQVEVLGFDHMLIDFAKEHHCHAIIRGLRAVSDFEFEMQMAGMNRQLAPSIETLFMTPREDYVYVSSSIIRNIYKHGGDISQLVDPLVITALTDNVAR